MERVLLKPQPVTITDMDGNERTFIISRMPAWQGREIMEQWPFACMPKFGSYTLREELSQKMMCFVAVVIGENQEKQQPLNSITLINSHVGDHITLRKLEDEMISYNGGFFQSGWILTFLEESIQKYLPRIIKISMASLGQLLQMVKQA